jgi:hypothetical protein
VFPTGFEFVQVAAVDHDARHGDRSGDGGDSGLRSVITPDQIFVIIYVLGRAF